MLVSSATAARLVGRALLVVAPLLPAALGAQTSATTLVGSVRDSAGRAVAGVDVLLNGGTLRTRTNDAGGFRVGVVPVGRTTVAFRRLGFAPANTVVTLRAGQIDSLVMSLTMVAATLPGVVVEDEATARSKQFIAGFWDRRSKGFGNFLTRAEIEAREASAFVDLVRNIPSTAIVSVNGRSTIRFKRSMSGRDCPPQYFVDGLRIEQGSPDEFTPEDVEAIEIYAGPATTPPQFAPRPWSNTCGAIVIWTRVPGN